LYCPGKGHELLLASAVFAVCQDSSVFLMRLLPLSIILALLKSMVWSKVQACFVTLEPLVHCLIFLICSFRLVLNDLFVSPM